MTNGRKRFFMLFCGLLETFIFSGNILGWAALNYMLKRQGVFHHLCVPLNNQTALRTNQSNTESDTYPEIQENLNCIAQNKMFNLAFTIGTFCIGLSAFVWGFLIDRWGLRIVRILINSIITTGAVLLSLTSSEMPYLIFPAITLMCLGGVPLRIANIQVANLFLKQRSTVITLYSGAFSASASVFILIKFAFDAGLEWQWVCLILVAASASMLPTTLFLFPPNRITENGEDERKLLFKGLSEISIIFPESLGKFSILPRSPLNIRKFSDDSVNVNNSTWDLPKEVTSSQTTIRITPFSSPSPRDPPLRDSLISFSFFMHQYWFSWLLVTTINYAGSLNVWLERVTNNVTSAAWYTQVYGLTQISALILAPLGGLLMDLNISNAAKENDADIKRLKILQSGFWPILFTTMTQAVIQICRFFNSVYAVYISVVFLTILRSLLVAVATAYLRIRFPDNHFNRLLGIMSTTAGMFTLLQYPLFIWESRSLEDAFYFNVFNLGMLVIAFIHPLLLIITPLQIHFIKKEKWRR